MVRCRGSWDKSHGYRYVVPSGLGGCAIEDARGVESTETGTLTGGWP